MARKGILITILAMMGVVLIFSSAGARIVVKYGHTGTPDHPQHLGALAFAKHVAERSGGEIEVRIFPLGQLGPERPMLEQVEAGTLQMTIVSSTVLANSVKEFGVLGLPFIYPDPETAYRVLDDREVRQKLSAFIELRGLALIGYGENEFRDLTNSKRPVTRPEDLRGLRIRTAEGPVVMDTFRALGAEPVFIPASEVYDSLRKKTIDGQEFSISTAVLMGFTQVNQFATMTDHILIECPIVVNKTFWNSLSEGQRNILREAALVQAKVNREGNAKARAEGLNKAGIQRLQIAVLSPQGRDAFRMAVKSVHDKYRVLFGPEWYDFFMGKIDSYRGRR